jgi:hypothetical protein
VAFDFEIEPAALRAGGPVVGGLGRGIAKAADEVGDERGSAGACGQPVLESALDACLGRWSAELTRIAAAIETIAQRLPETAAMYEQATAAGAQDFESLSGRVPGTGPR